MKLRIPRIGWGLLATGAALMIVCGVFAASTHKKTDEPQRWDKKKLGPLVPHKTFPADCGLCHVPKRWDVLRDDFSFDHEGKTGYKLEGAHAAAHCVRCHNDRGPVSRYIVRGCGGCHGDPHTGTLGTECTKCHNQVTWACSQPAVEHASGRFPLTGAHRSVACEQCHQNAKTGGFRNTATDCYSCHRTQYASAPNHLSRGYSQRCDTCHNTTSFANIHFDHSQLPGGGMGSCYSCHQRDFTSAPNHTAMSFPTTCERCHSTNAWRPATFDHSIVPGGTGNCVNCHQPDYQRAPNHAAMSFPTTCANCHTTTAWRPASFNHSALPGGGAGQCYTCHQSNFQTAPNHVSLNFPHACDSCHTTTAWTPATFDHSIIPGGTNGQCYTCHQSNYQSAANHVSLSYPTTCANCHTTTAWKPSTFVHSFPITGNHNVSCVTCHTTGVATFTCITCHAHAQASMNSKHSGVNGYTYNSNACYQCHPNGRSN